MSLTKRCIFLKVNLNVYTVVIKFYRNYVTNSFSFLKVKKFWKFLRGRGSSKTPLERKIMGGGGVQIKKSSVVGVWIFSGTTHSCFMFFFHHQHYPCVVVVGLGEKEVESDAETSEECKRTANLRQASGGKMLLIMVIIGHTVLRKA